MIPFSSKAPSKGTKLVGRGFNQEKLKWLINSILNNYNLDNILNFLTVLTNWKIIPNFCLSFFKTLVPMHEMILKHHDFSPLQRTVKAPRLFFAMVP